MKKALALFLGIVLFSGTAYAKIYWLPDYLGDNMSRSADDDSNRTTGCPSGTTTSSKDSNKYNCSVHKDALNKQHKVCYSCTPKPCGAGVIRSACNEANGYTWTPNSYYSGENRCGSCELTKCSGTPESSCNISNGYNFTKNGCKSAGVNYGTCKANDCSAYSTKSSCVTTNGYTYTQKCKSAGVDYGTCTATPCARGYSTAYQSVTNCGSCGANGWKFTSKGKSGGKVCGKCTEKACPSGYTSGVTSCSTGYSLSPSSSCNGNKACGKCVANDCSGTKQSDCNTSNGYTFTQTCKSGTTVYGTCTATPCPRGYYTAYQSVANCGSTGNSGWIFSSRDKSGGKICGKCTKRTCSGVTSVASCGTTGASGWTIGSATCYAGNTPYYTCSAKACASGTTYANRNCGANQIWKANSYYSGNDKCGTCVTTCQTTSCNQILIRANGNIMGLYMPAASLPSFCAGGSYFQSGNAHADVNDNCGIKRCFGCDVNATYKNYFENAGSSGPGVEDYFNNCLSGCMWATPPLAADKYVCYTMCNVAKQRWMLEHAGQNLTPQNQIFLCPYNQYNKLEPCCNNWSGNRQSLYNRLVSGQQFLAFSCNILKETPSCRPSCSSW